MALNLPHLAKNCFIEQAKKLKSNLPRVRRTHLSSHYSVTTRVAENTQAFLVTIRDSSKAVTTRCTKTFIPTPHPPETLLSLHIDFSS